MAEVFVIASINPGPAAAFFALSVACTMLVVQAVDPRLIWDGAEGPTAARA